MQPRSIFLVDPYPYLLVKCKFVVDLYIYFLIPHLRGLGVCREICVEKAGLGSLLGMKSHGYAMQGSL